MFQGTTSGTNSECEMCGAQLPTADGSGFGTCTFCRSVHSTLTGRAAPARPAGVGAPGYTSMPDVDPQPSSIARRGQGCLITVLFVLGVAVVGLFFGPDRPNPFSVTYAFGASTVVLPGEPSAPFAFVASSSHHADGKTVVELVRFNGTDPKAMWTSPTIADGTTDVPLLTDSVHVYAIAKTKVFAFKLSDGTLVWQAPLSDEVRASKGCDGCEVIGDKVVVKTKDGMVQAFDAVTGKAAWTRRLEQATSEIVRTGDQLVVIDGPLGKGVATTLNLADGTDAAVMAPTCQQSGGRVQQAGLSATYRRAPVRDELIVMFGSAPACIQGWNPATGALAWSVVADRTGFDNSSLTLLPVDAGLIIADRGNLGLISPDRTSYAKLLEDPDVSFHPIAASGPTLIVEAKNNRGTSNTFIQGIELATGTMKWEAGLGKAKSNASDPSPSFSVGPDGAFTTHVENGKVYVVTMKDQSSYDHTVFVDALDGATGTAAPQVQLSPKGRDLTPAFGPPTWRGSKMLARVGKDTIQVIDAATGLVTYKVP